MKPQKRRGGFYYDLPDQPKGVGYPSVTTLLKVIAKPELTFWLIRESVREALRTMSESEGVAYTQKIMKTAGGEGSVAHNLIDKYWEGDKYVKINQGDKVQEYLSAFEQFLKIYKPVCIQSEGEVYSHTGKYAGTFDGVFEIRGEKWLIDWKTSNGIYWDYKLQIIAYKNALEEMGTRVDKCAIVQLKNSGLPVVELVGEVENGIDLYKAFKCAKFLFNTKEVIK
jgi:hypothetical protein